MDDNIAFMRHPLTSSPLPDLNDSSTTLIPRLVMVGGTSPRTSTLMEQIQNRVSQYCTSLTIARSVSAIPKSELSADTTVLSLVDIDDPMLAHIDEEGWNSLREVLMTAGTLLWVTQGRLATVPHSNMMVGLLRSIVREVPSLNYRALDFEDVCIMNANIISEALLRFKAEILWRQQDKGLSTTVENELVINSQGGIMIPRFVTSQPMNDRYNSARRTIIGNFDRRTQNLTLVRRGSGESPTISRYELRQEAEVNSDNRHHGPSSGVIDAMYSIVSAVRVSRFGCLYAAIGECRASGKQVVFLSRTQSSIIRPPEQLVVRLDARIDSDREVTTLLSLVVYKLLALAALEDLSRGDIVPVHDPDLEFATALEEEARSAGIKTVMVASTRRTSSAAADYLMIHPSASDRAMAELLHLYVQNDSCYSFIDLSVPEADRSLANRIQSLLPAHCRQHTTRSLLSSTAWAAPSSQHLDKIQDRLDKAVHYGLARCKVSSSASAPVVPLQSPVVDVDETRASFSVLDWTSGGTNNVKSALIRPIDTQIAFSNHKTYWLAGLSGGLGIALCEWMARRNAKYFVISSRTPKVSESWLVAMRQKGVTVKIAAW
jgi:hybrid polyketide synthase/nonribosomal peptide synthetase ACE1